MVSNKGYGVFVNTTFRSNWRLDSTGLRKDLDMQNNTELSAYSFEVPLLSHIVSAFLVTTLDAFSPLAYIHPSGGPQ
jgi:hypothetical protein